MFKIAICKPIAFIKRDFLIQASYRIDFFFEWLSKIGMLATFYFIAKLFDPQTVTYFKEHNTDYFSFVFIGIAFSGYLSVALRSFSLNIRREQLMGTLEAMLVTPTKLSVIIISMCLWNFIFTTVSTLIYFLLGALLFGVNLDNVNISGSIIVLFLTLISFGSIGIIAASFIMVLKKGNPIMWFIGVSSQFFGGVFFPITVLPEWLRFISYLLPITYSLSALRYAILQGYSISLFFREIVILSGFALILLPTSIAVFRYAIKKSKIKGSLIHY